MLKKLMLLTLTICSITGLQAMDVSVKPATQAETKKQYDAKKTAELMELLTHWNRATSPSGAEEVARVKELIKAGADINKPLDMAHNGEFILLRYTIGIHNTDVIKALLDAGANPLITDREGKAPRKYLEDVRDRSNNRQLFLSKEQLLNLNIVIAMLKEAEKKWIPEAPPAHTPEASMTAGSSFVETTADMPTPQTVEKS